MNLTRRKAIFALSSPLLLPRASGSQLSCAGYIFEQYAARQKKPLAEVLDEVFGMAHAAGFRNVEISNTLLMPELRDRTFAALKANELRLPSIYVGGAMHTRDDAAATTARALETALLCKPLGCVGVVNNPDPKPKAEPKSDRELAMQASNLNDLGQVLKRRGFDLRIHNHTPEIVNDAREWRHTLHNTDPKLVSFCLDLDWVHQGGLKPLDLVKEAGPRLHEIHVRNSKDKLWLEDFADGDVDYREIVELLAKEKVKPLVVVELAYREQTAVTRPLGEDLRRSRIYAEDVFGMRHLAQ